MSDNLSNKCSSCELNSKKNNIKTIAFYLPQFHSIPENDEWWGDGFTDWTNVKNSKSLFKGHNAPEIPLNNNYYDLDNINVMIEQSQLAKEYGLYGFCYYHYWFDGKLLLEKPLEMMLENTKVDIPFCLSWANESWTRSWDGQNGKVLIEQNYEENLEGLKNHFFYLLKFFKDKRYIRINGKPLFIIYKPQLINNIDLLKSYWDDLAIENGIDGLFWAHQHFSSFKEKHIRASFDLGIRFEPWFTYDTDFFKNNKLYVVFNNLKHRLFHGPYKINYDAIWKTILKRPKDEYKTALGAYTSWDNTPRRGRNGYVFYKSTPEKFYNYLVKLFNKNITDDYDEFVFINAWNEWAEGAHLEPDEKNKFGYLNALKKALDNNSIF